VDNCVSELSALVDEVGPDLRAGDLDRILGLARRTQIGFFDAVYLDLAVGEGAALASRDAALLGAAAMAGVEVFDLR
jgi:predicted nucleic acid-binding protein